MLRKLIFLIVNTEIRKYLNILSRCQILEILCKKICEELFANLDKIKLGEVKRAVVNRRD